MNVKEFLEKIPPRQKKDVSNIADIRGGQYGKRFALNLPMLELHCATPECNGIRFFACQSEISLHPGKIQDEYVYYMCRNCGNSTKTFSLEITFDVDEVNGKLYKYGEVFPFGQPTPPRLISLIGPDKDMFLKGRKCENQALGIAAFAYYRRVIENQKNRILDEIIKVAERLKASSDQIEDLKAAKNESQFKMAIEKIKHGIPTALLVDNHNPLLLLHSALSEGLHILDDEQCLSRATHIRVVMVELAERIAQALKDNAEFNAAVSNLMQKKRS